LNSLLFEEDKCLKPAFSATEREWYEDMAAGKLDPLAAAVAPKFYGVVTKDVLDPATNTMRKLDYLVLQNTTFGFECPCIVDLKLGLRTWDKNCDERKMKTHRDIDKASTTGSVGFRFGGFVLCNKMDDGSVQHMNAGKNYGVFVDGDRVIEPLLAYLTGDPWHLGPERPSAEMPVSALTKPCTNGAVLARRCRMIVDKLQTMKAFFELGKYMTFASSIMIAYDAVQNDASGDEELDNLRVSVSLIDYAHVWHRDVYPDDSGALTGIKNLTDILNAIAADPDSQLARYHHS